jgi:hypothetical protein
MVLILYHQFIPKESSVLREVHVLIDAANFGAIT